MFDHQTRQFYQMASMQVARWNATAVHCNGKIYVIGGADRLSGTTKSLATVEAYNFAMDTWESLNDAPFALLYLSSVTVNHSFYICGGSRHVNGDALGQYNALYRFDTDNPQNGFIRLADMHVGATGLENMAYYNGALYFLSGGYFGTGQNLTHLNGNQKYIIAEDRWEPLPSPKDNRMYYNGAVMGNKVYVFVDYLNGHSSVTSKEFYVFDLETEMWEELDNFPYDVPRFGQLTSYNNTLYLFGSANFSDVYVYVPEDGCAEITHKYQITGGVSLQPDTTHSATLFAPYTATAPAITGYRCVGHIVDDSISSTYATAIIGSVTQNHEIVFLYEPVQTEPGAGNCCCCGEFNLNIKIPISNNLEVLDKLKEIAQIVKGCDNEGCCK